MTQRHKVSKCYWKMALIDLLNTGLTQNLNLLKKKTKPYAISVKYNKTNYK